VKGGIFRDPFFSSKSPAGTGTYSARSDWLGTLAARFGYTWDRWMLYGKAGAAWAHDKYSLDAVRGGSPQVLSLNGNETRTGWMVGVGLEYAFLSNWSAKLEYNYMDFGNKTVALAGFFDAASSPATADIDQQIHIVKVGLNYRFGDYGKGPVGKGPVVTRY
jgi:outer membrane immunogenic protein